MKTKFLLIITLIFVTGISAFSRIQNVQIQIKKEFLAERGQWIVYEPESNVRRASYTKYFFKKAEFISRIGKIESINNIRVLIRIDKTVKGNYSPSNPAAQQPSGGFNIINHFVSIMIVNR